MSELLPINELAYILLTPNDNLSQKIFDENDCIRNETVKYLLSQANFILFKTALTKIHNIEVNDIYLLGDYAGYFYNQYSQIDCLIEYKNNGILDISNKNDELNDFLNTIYYGSLNGFNFKLNDIKVNFQLSTHGSNIFPKYSLLHNKWVIKPDKNCTKDLSLNQILKEYKDYCYDIDAYLAIGYITDQFQTVEGLEQLLNYRKNIFKKAQNSVKDNIVFKLLKYAGIIKKIDNAYHDNMVNFLSIQ